MTDFESFYHNYRNLMYRIAYDLLKNTQDAEDAVQEAFLNIARSFSKIESAEEPQKRSFAAVITRNICLNKLRKISKTANYTDYDSIEEQEVSDGTTTENTVFSNLGVEILEEALNSLPQKYIDILYITAYEDMSLKEAAKLLGITYENAKSRLKRARKKLWEILKEKSYEE